MRSLGITQEQNVKKIAMDTSGSRRCEIAINTIQPKQPHRNTH